MGRLASQLMRVRHDMYLTGAQQVIFCVLQKPGRYIFGKGQLYGGGKSVRLVK